MLIDCTCDMIIRFEEGGVIWSSFNKTGDQEPLRCIGIEAYNSTIPDCKSFLPVLPTFFEKKEFGMRRQAIFLN